MITKAIVERYTKLICMFGVGSALSVGRLCTEYKINFEGAPIDELAIDGNDIRVYYSRSDDAWDYLDTHSQVVVRDFYEDLLFALAKDFKKKLFLKTS